MPTVYKPSHTNPTPLQAAPSCASEDIGFLVPGHRVCMALVGLKWFSLSMNQIKPHTFNGKLHSRPFMARKPATIRMLSMIINIIMGPQNYMSTVYKPSHTNPIPLQDPPSLAAEDVGFLVPGHRVCTVLVGLKWFSLSMNQIKPHTFNGKLHSRPFMVRKPATIRMLSMILNIIMGPQIYMSTVYKPSHTNPIPLQAAPSCASADVGFLVPGHRVCMALVGLKWFSLSMNQIKPHTFNGKLHSRPFMVRKPATIRMLSMILNIIMGPQNYMSTVYKPSHTNPIPLQAPPSLAAEDVGFLVPGHRVCTALVGLKWSSLSMNQIKPHTFNGKLHSRPFMVRKPATIRMLSMILDIIMGPQIYMSTVYKPSHTNPIPLQAAPSCASADVGFLVPGHRVCMALVGLKWLSLSMNQIKPHTVRQRIKKQKKVLKRLYFFSYNKT